MSKYWDDEKVLTFGKYKPTPNKKTTLRSAIIHDVAYITWCIENLPNFILDDDDYKFYELFAETPYLNSHLKK